MTIFPTHKTELKTKLPRHEVVKRLEDNDIYTVGFKYVLKENGISYRLEPKRKDRGRNILAPIIDVKISEKLPDTFITLSFYPLKATNIGLMIISLIFFAISIGAATFEIINTGFSTSKLFYIPICLLFYTIVMLMLSFEVISIRKQIEETVEAEIHEVTEEEMSKLQKWYEKKR